MTEKGPEAEVGDSLSLRQSALTNNMDEETSTEDEKKLLRRIDLFLMPMLTFSYMLQFLDKQTLNSASIMGIIEDLSLKGTDYTWSSSAFYFGYLAFSYPAAFLMVRLPLGKYLAGTSLVWAVILACHAATKNFTGLLILRLLLGAAEASISPGFSLITGMWYRRSEQPFRHGIWFFGNSIAVMFGGLLGYGIAHINGGLGPWRWNYIIFGVVTGLWGLVLFFFLPDTPTKARFLSEEQREKAVDRIRSNQTGIKDSHFKWHQVWEVLTDTKIWLLVIFQLTFSIPNGAFTTFSSLVLKGFGFNTFQVYLLNLPLGALHAIFSLGSTYLCSRYKNSRTIVAPLLSMVSLVGSILVRFGPNQGSRLLGLFLFIGYVAGFPISLSMISSNVAGFTKKSVASAMMFVAYTCGNIIGPFLFFPSEAPVYSSGFLATAVCFGVATLSMIALRFVLIIENKKRDKLEQAEPNTESDPLVLTDRTDKENTNFRYVY